MAKKKDEKVTRKLVGAQALNDDALEMATGGRVEKKRTGLLSSRYFVINDKTGKEEATYPSFLGLGNAKKRAYAKDREINGR